MALKIASLVLPDFSKPFIVKDDSRTVTIYLTLGLKQKWYYRLLMDFKEKITNRPNFDYCHSACHTCMLPLYLNNPFSCLPKEFRCENYDHLHFFSNALIQGVDTDCGCTYHNISDACFEKLREKFVLPQYPD